MSQVFRCEYRAIFHQPWVGFGGVLLTERVLPQIHGGIARGRKEGCVGAGACRM